MVETRKISNWPARFSAAHAWFFSWVEVDPVHAAGLLARVGLTVKRAVLRAAAVSFYPGTRLIAISRPGQTQDLFFLLPPDPDGDVAQLNGTNEPIYAFNDEHGAVLDRISQLDYIRFFFHFVRGQLGAFQIVERPEHIAWHPNAPAEIKTQAHGLLIPLTHRGQHRSGLLRNSATVIFKDALFKTDIFIAPRRLQDVMLDDDGFPENYSLGQSALKNEDLLMEDLPLTNDTRDCQ